MIEKRIIRSSINMNTKSWPDDWPDPRKYCGLDCDICGTIVENGQGHYPKQTKELIYYGDYYNIDVERVCEDCFNKLGPEERKGPESEE
tara:strand:- start:1027 stop:1293 length:267 start_codon:yes stop_codon:yes gene_type:complete